MTTAAPALPAITDAHRRAAFVRLRMRGTTFEAAMADPLRARVIEACAAQLRTAEWKRTHSRTVQCVRRFNPITGQWMTQRVPGNYDPNQAAIGLE